MSDNCDIISNVSRIKRNINSICKKNGRDPMSVKLLAATKTRSPDEILLAVSAGIDICGENRVQEMLAKLPSACYSSKPLHVIGSFQSNKAHLIIGKVDMIESVGSISSFNAVSRCSLKIGVKTDVLCELNIGEEESKSGFSVADFIKNSLSFFSVSNIRVRGLMVIPPAGEDSRPYFEKTRLIFDQIKQDAPNYFDTLSMGMSSDYEEAIEYGSNIVRIGTGIFGERVYY